jgi:CheY-like chemotaxis protein
MPDNLHILLVEPEALLRRTVSMTARSLGMSQVHEAASTGVAMRMVRQRRFSGAVIAVECLGSGTERRYDLSLVDELRAADAPGGRPMPIAILADQATPTLLAELRDRRISRVILKPFRAKVLLETIAGFGGGSQAGGTVPAPFKF